MNYSPSFTHEERVFSYRFFGQKSKATPRFSIEGLHVFTFTPTPLRISAKGPLIEGGSFNDIFDVDCRDKAILRAFLESEPLQTLIRGIFGHNIREIEIREEAIKVTFDRPIRGRVRGQANRICTENPADSEWIKALKIRLLKLSQIISRTTALTKDMKNGHAEVNPGRVFTFFFAGSTAFIIAAFLFTKFWFQT